MQRFLKRQGLWVAYAIFVAAVLLLEQDEPLFHYEGPYAAGKLIAWLMYLGFLGYSIYCTTQENFFKSLPKLMEYHWGRQIGTDLYLGLVLTTFVIYLNEGSLWVLLMWLPAIIVFANLATLLYVAVHYGSLIAHFTS